MKELLLKIKIATALQIKKEDNPKEYSEVKDLITRGYLTKLGSYEEIEAVIVRISQKGNDYLTKIQGYFLDLTYNYNKKKVVFH